MIGRVFGIAYAVGYFFQVDTVLRHGYAGIDDLLERFLLLYDLRWPCRIQQFRDEGADAVTVACDDVEVQGQILRYRWFNLVQRQLYIVQRISYLVGQRTHQAAGGA